MALSRINSKMVGAGDVDNTEHGTLDGKTAGSYLPAVGALVEMY